MTAAVSLALLAAALFGLGTAVQARAHAAMPARSSGRARLVTGARATWCGGTALDLLGSLAHLGALHLGPLAVVQPLSLSSIVVATPAACLLRGQAPTGRAMWAAVSTATGLGLMAVCLGSGLRTTTVGGRCSAVALAGATVLLVGSATTARRARSPRLQALALGAAAGASYGLSDALVRAVLLAAASQGWHAQVVLLGVVAVGSGGLGLLLTQLALQRGRVTDSLPVQDLLALTVSIGLGAAVLGELPRLSPLLAGGALVGLVLTCLGAHRLAAVPSGSNAGLGP